MKCDDDDEYSVRMLDYATGKYEYFIRWTGSTGTLRWVWSHSASKLIIT